MARGGGRRGVLPVPAADLVGVPSSMGGEAMAGIPDVKRAASPRSRIGISVHRIRGVRKEDPDCSWRRTSMMPPHHARRVAFHLVESCHKWFAATAGPELADRVK